MNDLTLEGCYAERVTPMPRLTDEQRAWLNAPERAQWLMKDVVLGFALKFRLTPFQCGQVLAQWVKELGEVPIPSGIRRVFPKIWKSV